jgi:hypothetical protein
VSDFELGPQMGHHQDVTEGHALRWASAGLRRRVKRLVNGDPFAAFRFGVSQTLDSLSPQIARYSQQAQALDRAGVTPYAAIFIDAENRTARLPTPVVVAEDQLADPVRFYRETLEILDKAGLPLEPTDPDVLKEAFIDRLAEHLTIADPPLAFGREHQQFPPGRVGVGGLTLTEVHTNREKDTVLVCDGYFASTATGFGVSTPAVGELTPGRYSFGILDGGQRRFDGVVWSCPRIVTLDLP